MKRKTLIFFTLLLGSLHMLNAQILNVTPIFPTADDTVTIIYDATQGNAELVGISPVYGHIGLITSASTSPTDWKYVQGTWGTADPNVLMTDLGNNKHQIKYHIRTFHGVPQNETVLKMAFVFRNADGSKVGRTAAGSDIFYDVYSANSALLTTFITPTVDQLAVSNGTSIPLSGAASKNCTMTIYDNGAQIAQVTNDNSINHTINATVSGNHLVELVADDGTTIVRDTFQYVVNAPVTTQQIPANTELGVNYINNTTVRLSLYAPNKQFVYVVGDFNNWQLDANYYMKRSTDNATWWLEISNLTPDTEYGFQYIVDNDITIADPYSEKVLDPWNDPWIPSVTYPNLKPYPTGKTTGIVGVMHPGKPAYQWNVSNFQKPAKEELVIYELLVRDFIARHDYETLLDTLDYLENLGINAIEFMPVNEFEGNESWGYNPSFHMALDKYYGSAEKFKMFIDECHSRGIAIILDVVYNHAFSQSPLCQLYWDNANFKPTANNPWLNPDARHPFNVGYDFNHEAQATKDWVDRVMKYWINEFKVDGFRFDLSKGITQTNNPNNVGAWGQYDQSRINLLKRIADVCWAEDPNFYVILEHFSDNSEEKVLSDYGMMLWGNLVHNYNEATMGWLGGSDFGWIDYKNRGWNNPYVVGYMESHDEERLMFKNKQFGNNYQGYNTKDESTALDRMELAAAFFFTIPGPKMLWQFGELGYDISIDDPCRVCNKPILWNYFTETDRRDLYDAYRAIINLRNDHDAFTTNNYNLGIGTGAIKTIRLYHNTMDVAILGNFDVSQQSVNMPFSQQGWWYDYMTGDSINVTGSNMNITLAPGQYHIYTSTKIQNAGQYVSNREVIKQNDFHLNAYPNPAQGFTQIAYHLPQSMDVQVELYNLVGQKVQTLRNEFQSEGDQYIELNTNDLPKGNYLLRLVANGQVSTQKIIVL